MSGGAEWRIREIDVGDDAGLSAVARLHMELLGFGPLAALGERFVREICYRALMQSAVLDVAMLEVAREPIGFIAYTKSSDAFHRAGLKQHWWRAGVELVRALVTQPGGFRKVLRALRWVASRRGEEQEKATSNGEVVCVAVQPRHLRSRAFGNLRASERLVAYAGERLRAGGVEEMRMLVERDNKAVLLLYHHLGARFEPYELGGEPQVQVWFNLESLHGVVG